MLANGAEYIDGKLYLLGGDFDTINASGVPLIYPLLVIVVKFWFEPGEMHHPNVLRVVPLGPEGQVLRPPFDMPLHPRGPRRRCRGLQSASTCSGSSSRSWGITVFASR